MLNLLPKWMDSSDLNSVLKFSLKGWHDENMISIPGKREDDRNATLVVFKIFHLDYMHRPGLYATQQSKVSNSAWIIYPCLSDGDKHKTGEEKRRGVHIPWCPQAERSWIQHKIHTDTTHSLATAFQMKRKIEALEKGGKRQRGPLSSRSAMFSRDSALQFCEISNCTSHSGSKWKLYSLVCCQTAAAFPAWVN